jgi:hypothetical protein
MGFGQLARCAKNLDSTVGTNNQRHTQMQSSEESQLCATAHLQPSYILTGLRYLSSIEERLKVVETRLFSLSTLTRPDSSGPENPGPRALTPKDGHQLARVEHTVETACVAEDVESSAGKEDSIDGMGAVSFAPEEDCAFFGASSNIALLRDISRAVSGFRLQLPNSRK